jgi:hypothetical protein
MVTNGFIPNQSFVDIIRAITATEARAVKYSVTVTNNSAVLFLENETFWTVSETDNGYSVTLPDGRTGDGTTVANALAAAKAELITP